MITACLLVIILVVLILYLRSIIDYLHDISTKLDTVRYFIMDYEKKQNCQK